MTQADYEVATDEVAIDELVIDELAVDEVAMSTNENPRETSISKVLAASSSQATEATASQQDDVE